MWRQLSDRVIICKLCAVILYLSVCLLNKESMTSGEEMQTFERDLRTWSHGLWKWRTCTFWLNVVLLLPFVPSFPHSWLDTRRLPVPRAEIAWAIDGRVRSLVSHLRGICTLSDFSPGPYQLRFFQYSTASCAIYPSNRLSRSPCGIRADSASKKLRK